MAQIECEIKYQRAVKIQILRKTKNGRRARKGGNNLNFKRELMIFLDICFLVILTGTFLGHPVECWLY